MNQTEIDEAVKLIAELDGKRTQGYWFWSCRTLRSEIEEIDEDGDSNIRHEDVLGVDTDKCIRGSKASRELIVAAPLMARTVAAQAEKIKRLEAMSQWQDISTAPRDGRKLCLWTPEYGGQPFIDWFTFNGDTGKTLDARPTHWMPLPTPPNAAMKE